ncbi:MAG: S8 family serine peptidase [Bacillota bacterium]|nr:S8 family serine peptidase [Bacillota bacterium]
MKKFIMFALSFIVAVTYGFAWTGQAYAAQSNAIKDPVKVSASDYKEHEALVMFKTKKAVSAKKAQSKLSSGKQVIEDVQIVDSWKFKDAAPEQAAGPAAQKGKKAKASASAGYSSIALVRSDSLTTKQLVNKLNKRSDVRYAEPNYKVHALAVSNDAYSDYQWSMEQAASNVEYQWNEKGVTGSDAIVAVVDTGVDYTHEDLADNIWENDNYPKLKGEHGFDIIGADDDPMDENGHGTHCAGIIGAVGNNGIGISGVNQNIKIMALRTLDAEGSGYASEEVGAYNYISKALDLGEPVVAINNSWGGGEDSDIFAELIDTVGEKGAVSVFAAGNDGMNNDEDAEYPCNIESDYMITVGATREDGQMASFSNYGVDSVDVAAPGTDILSTVFYDCYNPGIYQEDQLAETSLHFNDYEGAEEWGVPTEEQIALPEGASCDVSIADNGFVSNAALKLEFTGMKADDMAFITLPYTMSSGQPENAPFASFMAQSDTPDSSDLWDPSFFIAADMPADAAVTAESIDEYSFDGYYVSGQQDDWNHYCYECLQDEDVSKGDLATDRKIVLALYAAKAGTYTMYLDDMGISKDTVDPERYGKYDFMSGTSMATPFITGSVALKKAELGDVDTTTLINETIALAKEAPELPVNAGSSFDFSKKPAEPSPRISSVQVGKEPGTILIKGTGLKPSTGLDVQVSYAGEDEFSAAEIISQNDEGTEVIIKDNGWINNYIDLKATGFNGKIAKRSNVYLVKGKDKYTAVKEAMGIADGSKLFTDGDRIYMASSESDSIMAFDPAKPDDGFNDVAEVDYAEIFDAEENENAMYDMLFSRDMAIISNTAYAVVEYGEGVEEASDEDFWFFFSNSGKYGHNVILADEDEDEDEEYAACGALYSSELRLIAADLATGKVTDLGALPEDLEKTMDWTLTSYNGQLYFMGGYSQAKGNKGLTNAVKVYDPATAEWTDGPALPKAAAFGHALQTGGNIVYTLGYTEDQTGVAVDDQACPANMVFDGSAWKVSEADLSPMVVLDTVKRGGNDYVVYDGNIGVTKDGIVYIGMPAEDYGDTFVYDINKDAFADTGLNYYSKVEDVAVQGVSAGELIYAFDSDESVSVAPIESGFIAVTCGKIKHGKVTGVNRYYNPGDMAKITAKGTGKYKVKSMKVGSKKVKIKKKVKSKTYITPPLTEDLKVVVKFKK